MKRSFIICTLGLCLVLSGCGQKKADWMTQPAQVQTYTPITVTENTNMMPDTSSNTGDNSAPVEMFTSVQEANNAELTPAGTEEPSAVSTEASPQSVTESAVQEAPAAVQPTTEVSSTQTTRVEQPTAGAPSAQTTNSQFLSNLPNGFVAIDPVDPKQVQPAPAQQEEEPADEQADQLQVTIFETYDIVEEGSVGAAQYTIDGQDYFAIRTYAYQMSDGAVLSNLERPGNKLVMTSDKDHKQYELLNVSMDAVKSSKWITDTQYVKTYTCTAKPYIADSVIVED